MEINLKMNSIFRNIYNEEIQQVANKAPISTMQAVLIFFGLVLLVILISFVKKTFYRYQHKKRYFVMPKLGVKGLAYIGMVIAVSVSIILIFATITSGAANALFRALPGSRVAIESVLIKIGGLLFGPMLGLFIGAAIDFLTVALSGGVFHYGYLISAMAFGMFAGFIRILIDYSRGKNIRFAAYSTILILLAYAGLSILIMLVKFSASDPNSISFNFFQSTSEDGILKYGLSIKISKAAIIGILGGFFGFFIAVIWITL
jgi:LytS/YehU family sensor histidine kinase